MALKITLAIIISLILIGLLTYLVVDLIRQIKRIYYKRKGIEQPQKKTKKPKDIDYE